MTKWLHRGIPAIGVVVAEGKATVAVAGVVEKAGAAVAVAVAMPPEVAEAAK